MKTALVLGAGGFIGGHLTKRLKNMGYWVRGVDIKYHEFDNCHADDFILADLTLQENYPKIFDRHFDEVYSMAALMGGALFVFSQDNDADIMHDSCMINLNVAHWCAKTKVGKVFFSSSACIYPEYNQLDPNNPVCTESTATQKTGFQPDSLYGLEKAFAENLYMAYNKNYGLNVRIARFHNIFGPYGTWCGGKEKAPAALSRKIASIKGKEGSIDVIGDGNQTRSFLYIDECIEGVIRLMDSDFMEPVNIGSDEMVSINQLVEYIADIAHKDVSIKHIEGPQGVRGRTSDNALIYEKLGWKPTQSLKDGLIKTYEWIEKQVNKI